MANRRNLIGRVAVTMSDTEEIVQGSYTVNLNGQWEETTAVPNPDSTLYDGVYRSSSSYNVNSGVSIMYITIKNYSSFKIYIRSYAESNYDYVMVSQLDKTITGSSSYSDTTLVKAHTRGNQQSGTALSNYTLVEFTGITPGEHTITVLYRKDSSVNNGDDRGYVLIKKIQADSGDTGEDDEGGSNERPLDINNYLTIVALEDGLTARLSKKACEYCVDGNGNWKTLPASNSTVTINTGQTLSFRGNLTPLSSQGIGTFTISKSCNLEGNCMSMLFGDEAANNFSLSGKDWVFFELFRNCTTIKRVSSGFLPATTLASYCYLNMFRGCTSLTQAPELPAVRLNSGCYDAMFRGCTSLTIAPELPATTLVTDCYTYMFADCSKLNYIKAMFTTSPISGVYATSWVQGVASTGTFVKNPDATWEVTGISGIIPSGWTVVNDGEESGDTIELPIKLYEGNNNPEAAQIIDFVRENWMQYADENGRLFFDNHPDIFQNPRNIIHINDTYYCNALNCSDLMGDGQNLYSFDAGSETYYLADDRPSYDILQWDLYRNGELFIEWD